MFGKAISLEETFPLATRSCLYMTQAPSPPHKEQDVPFPYSRTARTCRPKRPRICLPRKKKKGPQKVMRIFFRPPAIFLFAPSPPPTPKGRLGRPIRARARPRVAEQKAASAGGAGGGVRRSCGEGVGSAAAAWRRCQAAPSLGLSDLVAQWIPPFFPFGCFSSSTTNQERMPIVSHGYLPFENGDHGPLEG